MAVHEIRRAQSCEAGTVGYLVSVATDGFIDALDLIVSVLPDTQ